MIALLVSALDVNANHFAFLEGRGLANVPGGGLIEETWTGQLLDSQLMTWRVVSLPDGRNFKLEETGFASIFKDKEGRWTLKRSASTPDGKTADQVYVLESTAPGHVTFLNVKNQDRMAYTAVEGGVARTQTFKDLPHEPFKVTFRKSKAEKGF